MEEGREVENFRPTSPTMPLPAAVAHMVDGGGRPRRQPRMQTRSSSRTAAAEPSERRRPPLVLQPFESLSLTPTSSSPPQVGQRPPPRTATLQEVLLPAVALPPQLSIGRLVSSCAGAQLRRCPNSSPCLASPPAPPLATQASSRGAAPRPPLVEQKQQQHQQQLRAQPGPPEKKAAKPAACKSSAVFGELECCSKLPPQVPLT